VTEEHWRAAPKWQRLEPYETVAAMIVRHWDEIVTYFRPGNKVALRFVDELNNKIRMFQRRAYGLRSKGTCGSRSSPAYGRRSAGKHQPKVDPEFLALHESYREAQQRGANLRSNNSLLRVVDDRVVIAPRLLGTHGPSGDLIGLGMRNAAVFGPAAGVRPAPARRG